MAKIYLKKVKGSVFSCDGCFYYDNLIDCAGNCINKERGYIYIQVPAPEENNNITKAIKVNHIWFCTHCCSFISQFNNSALYQYCSHCGKKIDWKNSTKNEE